ncbi:MAG: hypothetical protein BIFFINMI_03084 [Phycisphaerae bacterium]|nr:hypothetical protein [Phycisphaerae bacterium]
MPATRTEASPLITLLVRIVLLSGAGLCFASFFVPWWGIDYDPRGVGEIKDVNEKKRVTDEVNNTIKDNAEWYRDHGSSHIQPVIDGRKRSASLFGWSVPSGIIAFIFAIVIVALVLAPWFVPLLRLWAWIGYVIAIGLMLPVLILSMAWLFGSPGENVGGYFAQGVIAGPFLGLVGALAALAAAIVGLIFGLMAFVAAMKSGSASKRRG